MLSLVSCGNAVTNWETQFRSIFGGQTFSKLGDTPRGMTYERYLQKEKVLRLLGYLSRHSTMLLVNIYPSQNSVRQSHSHETINHSSPGTATFEMSRHIFTSSSCFLTLSAPPCGACSPPVVKNAPDFNLAANPSPADHSVKT